MEIRPVGLEPGGLPTSGTNCECTVQVRGTRQEAISRNEGYNQGRFSDLVTHSVPSSGRAAKQCSYRRKDAE